MSDREWNLEPDLNSKQLECDLKWGLCTVHMCVEHGVNMWPPHVPHNPLTQSTPVSVSMATCNSGSPFSFELGTKITKSTRNKDKTAAINEACDQWSTQLVFLLTTGFTCGDRVCTV